MLNALDKFCKDKEILYSFTDGASLFFEEALTLNAPFSSYTREEKINPKICFPSCETIFVFLMPYSLNKNNINKPYIASGYSNFDYHKILESYIKEFIIILKKYKTFQYKIQVDTGPLMEKHFAKRSGLGQIGKNNLLINKIHGSKTFIGLLLVDFKMEKYPILKNENYCSTCEKCISACPTAAIGENFNYKKCISYLTQNKDISVLDNVKDYSNHIFGCDICIKACPYNTTENKNILNYNYDDFFHLSNKNFKEKFENKGFAWQGNAIIKRNSIICYGNNKKNDLSKLKSIDTQNKNIQITLNKILNKREE